MRTAFAISAALLGAWEPGPEAEAVGDIWVLFDCVGLVILEWRVRFPCSFLAFYCASGLAVGKRDVFAFKIRTKRKESFVNEISVKSLGVKSKSCHHSFIYFHFLKC